MKLSERTSRDWNWRSGVMKKGGCRMIHRISRGIAVGAVLFISLSAWPSSLDLYDLACGRARAMSGQHRDEGAFGPVLVEFPGDTDVLSCALEIELLPTTDSILGRNTMVVKSLSPTLNEFTIRLRSNFDATISITVDGTSATWVRLDVPTLKVVLPRTYGLNEQFTMVVNYNGQPVSRGYGSFDYTTHNGVVVASTLSEPYYAYTWWPAKDDNADKFTLDMWITCPNSWLAPSNGVLLSTENLSGNRKRYHWRESYPIVTYLVSIGATNYNTWTVPYNHPGGTMPVTFFIYPEHDSAGNRAAWEKCVPMLATFRGVFGEYPFINEKYGIYQFPFGGGMEHQTMTGQGTFDESVTAHELGHQWWGDMVTCKTWGDIWLNEGFATYSEALWYERRAGSSGLPALHSHMAARRPGNVSSTVYVTDTSSMGRIFDYNHTYLKGGWVLHQLRHVVGDDTFFNILAHYRSLYEYNSATTDDFKNAAEAVYGQDLDWYFNQWVYGPGAPAYQWGASQSVANGKNYLLVSVTQTQSYPVFTMPIDIKWVGLGGTTRSVIWNDANNENYVIPVDGPLDLAQVAFDDQTWILRTSTGRVAYVPRGPRIVETSPTPGAAMECDDPINVTFHTDVNTTAADYTLVGQNSGPRAFTFSYTKATYTTTLVPTEPLPIDTYTLTVRDTVTAVDSGQGLDGEIANASAPASLPSGDGQPLGSSVLRFSVTEETAAQITGTITLEDLVGSEAGLPLTIRVKTNGQTLETLNVTLGENGSYSVASNCQGAVDLVAQVDRWLSAKVTGVVLHGAVQQNWTLQYTGDTDGNNLIDDADITNVVLAYGTTGSLLAEDVNLDGVVDDADLTLVILNFDRQGEE